MPRLQLGREIDILRPSSYAAGMVDIKKTIKQVRQGLNKPIGGVPSADVKIKPVCPHCSFAFDTAVFPTGQKINCPKCHGEFKFGLDKVEVNNAVIGIIVGLGFLYIAWLLF